MTSPGYAAPDHDVVPTSTRCASRAQLSRLCDGNGYGEPVTLVRRTYKTSTQMSYKAWVHTAGAKPR